MKQPSYRSRIRGEAFYKLLPIFVSQVPAAESGLQIPAGRIKMYSYEEVLDQIENGRRFGNRPGVEITGIMLEQMGQPQNGTQYITMRTPIFPSPREAVTVVPIHTLYMNSSVPFWKNANLLSMTSWALTGQVQESVRTNPL